MFQNHFDEKGTKDFLNSKEKALMEIQLDDETNNKDNECEIEINNILRTEVINKNELEENIQTNKKVKIPRERTIKTVSPKKKSIKKIKNSKTTKNFQIFENDTETNNMNIENKNEDSHDSNYIYKFIIDNANESEDKFYDKLENVMKKVEVKNQNSPKKRNTNKTNKTSKTSIIKKMIQIKI